MFPSDRGNVAKPVRMAHGSLIIQARCGYTDRETVQQIMENPYLQYFIGLKEYQLTRPFTPVAMVKFRKRFKAERLARINELILAAEKEALQKEKEEDDDDQNNDDQGGSSKVDREPCEDIVVEEANLKEIANKGTIILDATCTPADLRYPTDLGLLNEAWEKLDEIINTLHEAKGKRQGNLELTERPHEKLSWQFPNKGVHLRTSCVRPSKNSCNSANGICAS